MVANAAVGKSWASHATGILTGLVAGATCLLGALDLLGSPVLTSGLSAGAKLGIDLGTMITGLVAAAFTSKLVRERIAHLVPVDPENPVHALALALAVILLGSQLTSIAFTNVLATEQAQPALTVGDLVIQELPFLILALFGVGIFARRSFADALQRLGLVIPTWWQPVVAVAAAGVFFAFGQQMDVWNHSVVPQVARQVDVTNQHLFGALNGPFAIAALALAPGICEELLFRGALQPRIGLLATALLFTSLHTQYGLSLDALSVFVIALGLGAIRKYTNTTTSCLCHVSYNLVTAIGITGAVLGVAVVVELVLVAVSAYAIWSRRSQPVPAES
jgi:membrane protease YdiL (CAAX protease family)